jgi:hypothetical protein
MTGDVGPGRGFPLASKRGIDINLKVIVHCVGVPTHLSTCAQQTVLKSPPSQGFPTGTSAQVRQPGSSLSHLPLLFASPIHAFNGLKSEICFICALTIGTMRGFTFTPAEENITVSKSAQLPPASKSKGTMPPHPKSPKLAIPKRLE